jgi:hypothetical protein
MDERGRRDAGARLAASDRAAMPMDSSSIRHPISNSGVPPQGAWRRFDLIQAQNVRLCQGPRYTGPRHSMRQTWVETVDLDVDA